MRYAVPVAALLLPLLLAPPVRAEKAAAPVFQLARAYTVRIRTQITTPFVEDGRGSIEGAGFLVDAGRRWILTNAHVVGHSPSEVQVAFAGEPYHPAHKVYVDSFSDVAVIAVDAIPRGHPAARLRCAEAPSVGEPIAVFGHPLGVPFVGSRGIVSGQMDEDGATLLQIDAAVNPGNSGGPVISLEDGLVVGIATSMATGAKVDRANFATPMADVCRILALLRAGHPASPARMPFSLLVDEDDRNTLRVGENQDPARWPFETGDRILRAGDSDSLADLSDLVTALRGCTGPVPVVVERGGRHVTLTARPELATPVTERRALLVDGMLVAPCDFEDGRTLRAAFPLMVHSVEPGSRAEVLGIQEQDLLRTVGDRPVTSLDSLAALLHAEPKGTPVPIVLCRFSASTHRVFDLQARELPCDEVRLVGPDGARTELSAR